MIPSYFLQKKNVKHIAIMIIKLITLIHPEAISFYPENQFNVVVFSPYNEDSTNREYIKI